MAEFSHEKLEVYKQAMRLVRTVYQLTKDFPNHEKFGLTSQLIRAIISVPSNLAEASGRTSYKEKIRFVEIAYGSLMESLCQLEIACTLEYLTTESYTEVRNHISYVAALLTNLRKNYSEKISLIF